MDRQIASTAPRRRLAPSLAALAAVATLWHAPACAQAEREIAYAGLGIGQSNYKWRNNPSGSTGICGAIGQISCEDKPVAFKLFVGYNLTDNFGIEGAYYDAGRASLTYADPLFGSINQKAILNGYSVSAVGTLPVGRAFVSGRIGVAASTLIRKDEAVGIGIREQRTKPQPTLGVGGGFTLWRSIAARLDWDRYRGESARGERFEADVVTLNLFYRFQ